MTIEQLHEIDQKATLWLNGFDSCISDPIMQFFSNIPVWIPMYVIVLVFLFIRLGWKKAMIVAATIALTFLLCDQFSSFVKNTVARPRPCHDEFMVSNGLNILEGKGGLYGFFSGHASNSFGYAFSSWIGFRNDKRLKYRGYAAWIFFWAFMMSISRIFVGKHYLGDILAGAVIGSAFGIGCALAGRFFIRKYIR